VSVFDILDKAFAFKGQHKGFLQRRLPGNVNYFYCFGGLAFTFFLLLLLSGLILSVHYVPSDGDAFGSIVRLRNGVSGGWFVRSVHRWSAHLMVTMLLFHVTRVVLSGAYRPPRQLTWVAGACLFAVTLGFGFTGYLLPWDQKAYWATTVGTEMARTVPLVGGWLVALLRGGRDVGGLTLIRFYAFHTLWFPFMMVALLWAHFHMIKKRGIYGGL